MLKKKPHGIEIEAETKNKNEIDNAENTYSQPDKSGSRPQI
jgi:hypothetical protein